MLLFWTIFINYLTLLDYHCFLGFFVDEEVIMKLSNFLLMFAIALLCLFSLQAFWLYNTYQLHLGNIKKSINSIFCQAIEKEMDQRFLELEKTIKENMSNSNLRIASFDINYGGIQKGMDRNSVVSQQFDMVQQLMETYNIHFNVVKVDSIFHSLLQSNQYPFRYRINYADSTGRILETAGQMIDNGFKTDVLPIINKEKINAIVEIPAPVVFKNMLAILTVSILIVFFIIACLIYEIKIFLNQHHLIQLRKNFTHALTHEMKTPLSTVHTVLVQLEKGALDKNPDLQQKFSTIAIDQVVNLQDMVDQILTLAYIEKRQLSLNKQSINLPILIQSLIDKFTIKSDKMVVFNSFFDLKDSIVYADPFYLENAISNLIDNAIKYSDDSVKIEIECAAGEKHSYIHVKDNGFGISFNDRLKIFKRFERGAEIKRNYTSGFGIGLDYVQQVIKAHGGTVSVLSQEGVGSEFIITLPA